MSTAIFFDHYGDPDVLHVGDEDVAAPGPGEVRVTNRVVGVNPADWKLLAGAFGREHTLPGVLGFEAAGVVDAVGDDVEHVAVGDEVVWHGLGAQRELSVVPAAQVLAKPESVSFEQAAVLPVAAATAFSALVQADVGEGDVVLLHGAAGGTGSAAVQIALALGARVIGTASEHNHDYLRALGAEPVLYGEGLVEAVRALPGDVSAVVDLVGTPESVAATVELAVDVARAVTIASSAASREAGITEKVDRKGALAEVLALAEAGRLEIEISERYPLARAADALRHSAAGHVRGKIVLEV